MSSIRRSDGADKDAAVRQDGKGKDDGTGGAAVTGAEDTDKVKDASKGGHSPDEKGDDGATKAKEGSVKPEAVGDHPWRAVWDATRHAWYFWNSETQETTWTNPLEARASTGEVATTSSSPQQTAPAITSHESSTHEAKGRVTDEEEASTIDGIDADLAYLDPTLYAAKMQQARRSASTTGNPGALSDQAYRAQGVFDTRTGRFVVPSAGALAGDSLSSRQALQQSQAHRQMSAFFDVQGHEEQRKRHFEADDEDERRQQRRAHPTRKEVKMFKERAKEKKAGKHSWLRN